jgi:hypothetical protein
VLAYAHSIQRCLPPGLPSVIDDHPSQPPGRDLWLPLA